MESDTASKIGCDYSLLNSLFKLATTKCQGFTILAVCRGSIGHRWIPLIKVQLCGKPQIAKFMGPTWGSPGSCRPQVGPMKLVIRVFVTSWHLYLQNHQVVLQAVPNQDCVFRKEAQQMILHILKCSSHILQGAFSQPTEPSIVVNDRFGRLDQLFIYWF